MLAGHFTDEVAVMMPYKGMKVWMGHLLLNGERSGIVVDCHHPFSKENWWLCDVKVDFMPGDGDRNPPGKVVCDCYYAEKKPKVVLHGL